MILEVDTSTSEPVYEQIVRQIEDHVRAGTLPPGAALPSIRQLADDLELNPNTVAKAYKLLELSRVILTAGRKGTFVRSEAPDQIAQKRHNDLAAKMKDMVSDFLGKGLSPDEVKSAFDTALGVKSDTKT